MKHPDLVAQYLSDIDSGRRVAGRLELCAVERYRRDLAESKRWVLDAAKGEHVLRFFNSLQLTAGPLAGQPFVPHPWQAFILWNLFGWRDAKTGTRRFTRALIELGRGNGKTPLGAALGIYVVGFETPLLAEAQGYFCATKGDQARLAFNQAKRFIDTNENGLKDYAEVYQHEIQFPVNRGFLKPISSDGKTADGQVPQFVLKDELHAWTRFHQDFNGRLETGLMKNPQPLAVSITTAGDDTSEMWLKEYDYCKAVVDIESGIRDERQFVFICEIDGDSIAGISGDQVVDDPLDEAVWPKANPVMTYAPGMINLDSLRGMADRAKFDPQIKHQLVRFHANKLVTSMSRLFSDEQWSKGNGEIPWDLIDKGEVEAYCALDWGWRDDLAALGWCFPLDTVDVSGETKRRYALHVDVWAPQHTKRDLSRPPYSNWIDEGWLAVTTGETTDVGAIYRTFAERWEMWDIRGVAFDANNAREFGSRIEEEYGLKAYAFPQSATKYHEPTRELACGLLEDRIVHGGNPLLAWAARNAIARESSTAGEYIMPDKRHSKDKIDPVVAVIMALAEAMFAERNRRTYYEDNEVELA